MRSWFQVLYLMTMTALLILALSSHYVINVHIICVVRVMSYIISVFQNQSIIKGQIAILLLKSLLSSSVPGDSAEIQC